MWRKTKPSRVHGQQHMKRRVVITGLGVVTSLGSEVNDFWQKLLAGQSGVHALRLVNTEKFKIKFGGDIWDWSPEAYPGVFLDKKDIKRVDRFTQFAMVAGYYAVQDSGLDFTKEISRNCGVILGSGIGGLHEIEEQVGKLIEKGPDRVSPFTVPKMMLNAAGGNLSIRFGLKGVNYSVATACASANNAIGDALRSIQHGEADILLTGGTEAAITQMGLSAFTNMKALSTRNEAPHLASRPFDADRDGFVLSEGAGLLVFEELEHAKARGAKIYAEVLGFGASADAGHITQPDEQGAGAGQAMRDALNDAKLDATQVDYISAHGTSTPLGDVAETNAIKGVFGDYAKKVSISSIKSHIGHTLGACGGIAMVAGLKAMEHNVVPPTINLDNPDPACDLDYTPNQPRERKVDVVLSNSFGFGGHNACVVVGRYK